ncbi:MAG: exo-alpha-sialidase [Dehalococcoidales bacterium]|nr:exo-alpha-sialidase [Dehalococcoidales bacterium]
MKVLHRKFTTQLIFFLALMIFLHASLQSAIVSASIADTSTEFEMSDIWNTENSGQVIQVTDNTSYEISPAITKSSDGTLWTVWWSKQEPSGIYGSISTDGGTTWSEARLITSEIKYSHKPSIMYTKDGILLLVCGRYLDYYDNLWCLTSTDNGGTWSELSQITFETSLNNYPSITQLTDGTILVVWRRLDYETGGIYCKSSADNGITWSETTRLVIPPDYAGQPSIMQTPDGTIWLAWQDSFQNNTDIWYSTSCDNGTSWSEKSQVTTHYRSDGLPSLAQTEDGKIWIVWISDRSGNNDIWYVVSDDAGVSWSPPNQFTQYFGLDNQVDITPVSQEQIGIVWTSTRNGNYNIWFGIPGVYQISGFPTGDTNFDGKVNVKDLTTLAGIILQRYKEYPEVDVNQDGLVNIFDISYLILIILGLA